LLCGRKAPKQHDTNVAYKRDGLACRRRSNGSARPKWHSQAAMRATLESTLRLSQDVLMCLFVGVIRCVDLHLPPEGLHFVFEGDALDLTSATTASGLIDGRMADVPSVRFRLKGHDEAK
jgi:hypothetical protein